MSRPRLALAAILLLYAVMAAVGITWGLPSVRIDPYLFGGEPPWPGEKIARLAKASDKTSTSRGADVDADPLDLSSNGPIELTATEADVAAIYLRYRLYTHQPDEMITMMALAGMKPQQLQFDPRLYQYGGLFIYPVGAAIGLCGALGLVHVTSNLTWYLDHPGEFGKFYVIARTYVALWGALGVVLVYAIATRLAGKIQNSEFKIQNASPRRAGLCAALLFTLMPITICMSHEAKPHLPGAVLMLAAVWFAMRYVGNSEFNPGAPGQNSKKNRRDWLLMCLSCGAAFGMVLSALPIFVLIPLAEWLRRLPRLSRSSNLRSEISDSQSELVDPASSSTAPSASPPVNPLRPGAPGHSALHACAGLALAFAVYLATNPYVAINAVCNREVLRSNLRNSTAMYEFGRVGEGLVRAIQLTIGGASPILLVAGGVSMAVLLVSVQRRAWPLLVPAGVVFVQFVMLGAGKPAEYGRFGVFVDAALAIATACAIAAVAKRLPRRLLVLPLLGLISGVGYFGWPYLNNFQQDAGPDNTRERLAAQLSGPQSAFRPAAPGHSAICILADPAPYVLPPLDFSRVRVFRYPSRDAYEADPRGPLIMPVDRDEPQNSPISWANKPFVRQSAAKGASHETPDSP